MKNSDFIFGKSKPRKRYIVTDQPTDYSARYGYSMDEHIAVYATMDEALEAAERDWRYLARDEKRKRTIVVSYIPAEDAPDSAAGDRDFAGDIGPEGLEGQTDEEWAAQFESYAKFIKNYTFEGGEEGE